MITVRQMRPDEGGTFLELHSRAIRGLAAAHYPPEVISTWATPVTEATIGRFLENPDQEVRLIAELDGVPVGLGSVVIPASELRACYVVPEASRKGVGTALVTEIERIANKNGVTRLELHSSINAEPFYAALGYEVIERGEHVLRSGLRMAAVTMVKSLQADG
jgi:putative acetyltransferase